MSKLATPLSNIQARNAKDKRYKLTNGGGMYLAVVQEWVDYLDTVEQGGNVIHAKFKSA